MIPPRRPWVLECGICHHLRRTHHDAWLICDTCDWTPTPTTRETTR